MSHCVAGQASYASAVTKQSTKTLVVRTLLALTVELQVQGVGAPQPAASKPSGH